MFNGNSGKSDIVKHSLKEVVSARSIRFQPTKYNNRKALRVEVFGVLLSTGINFFQSTGKCNVLIELFFVKKKYLFSQCERTVYLVSFSLMYVCHTDQIRALIKIKSQ